MSTARTPPIAIVGIGCLFPKARDLAGYWANIKHRIDGIAEVPESHWRVADYFDPDPKAPDRTYARHGGFLDPVEFDPLEWGIAPNALEATDTTQLLGLVAAREALRDAGYGGERDFDRERASVVLGITSTLPLVISLGARLGHPIWRRALAEAGVEPERAEDVVQRIGDAYVPWQEASFPGLLGNVAAGRIAARLDLHGTNCVVDAACASSLSAVHLACLELGAGHCDLAVSGGLDTFNDIFMYMCFSKTPALSPSGHARPFDAEADGTTLGEGLGVLVLKRLEDAERDGDRIYAVIRGIGSSSDGRGQAIYAPSAEGQRRALERAYENAGFSPATVELVEAHGTGTRVGDAIELTALAAVYGAADDGEREPWCAVGSVKSQIGHTKAAAGAASLIKAALALHDKVLPPTMKVERPNEAIPIERSPLYLNTEPRPWLAPAEHPRRAAVSALGFGGSNFHCVLEEHGTHRDEVQWDGRTHLLPFSADTPEAILEALASWSRETTGLELRRRCGVARRGFRSDAECRLVLAPASEGELPALLDEAAEALRRDSAGAWTTPRGASFGRGPADGGVALLFPGQGAQYPSMLRDLACTFPELLESLEAADRAFDGPGRLSDRIFPRPAFDDATRSRQEAALRATDVAQPALGAVSFGAFRLLRERFGLRPDAALGHSYGELVALAAGGRLGEEELHRLSGLRGRLMAAARDGDPGSMLAVQSDQELSAELLGEELVVANRNSPRQRVLSGPTPAIEAAEARLREEGIRCVRLDVAAAFHSSLVADAAEPWAEGLASIAFPDAEVAVIANSTGEAYPDDAESARSLLAGQLAHPVEFVGCVETLYRSGCRTFLEIGPGRRLGGLVRETLGERPHRTVAIDASSGRHPGELDLARSLAQLAALGHPVELAAWDPAAADLPEPAAGRFTVRLSGANHFEPPPARPPLPRTVAPAATATAPSSSPPIATTPSGADASQLLEALKVSQEGLTALQRLQEQTAELHRRFLEGQEAAQRGFLELLDQQNRLLGGAPATPSALASPPPPVRPSAPPLPTQPLPGPIVAPAQQASSAFQAASAALLEVVAEKTGYPTEMLDLDMGLDADLGIDSIKRVEILSALRDRLPGAPELAPDRLAALHTLREIADVLGAGPAAPVAKTAPAAPAPAPPFDDAPTVLLEVVAEKTGYPAEMLDLDMGLDADLGIDSIKRVEILSALRDRLPGAPELAADRLASLHTLREIADALRPLPVDPDHPGEPPFGIDPGAVLLEVVAEKTGYPAEMLDLDMGLDADLGIDSIKRVEILSALRDRLPGAPELAADRLAALHTLREIAEALGGDSQPPTSPASQPVATTTEPGAEEAAAPPPPSRPRPEAPDPRQASQRARREVLGLSALPVPADRPGDPLPTEGPVVIAGPEPFASELATTLEATGLPTHRIAVGEPVPEGVLRALVLAAPEGELDPGFPLAAFRTLRSAAPGLRAAPGSRLLTVSHLDGAFGLGSLDPDSEILSGALAGLTKTAAREWPEVRCTALDLAPGLPAVAAWIRDELLATGPIEIGCGPSGVVTPTLSEEPSPAGGLPLLGPDDVVLVTGGARGVTAAVAIQLASMSSSTFVLLGRTPPPESEPEWAAGLDDAALKAELFRRLESPEPRDVEAAFRRLRAEGEIRDTLARIDATGATALYRGVDVRDEATVRRLVAEIEEVVGPITALVHGAGVLADRRIEDKSDEDFERVFATKVEGLLNLLTALGDRPLRALVLFSSSTARFGRRGQADYAAANEVLNKIAQREARRRADCRVVSVNWGPWDGGMVTPELARVFRQEGIELLPLDVGARWLDHELRTPGPVEMVVLGAPAEGTAPPRTVLEMPEDLDATVAVSRGVPSRELLPVAFARELALASHPFLASHVLAGRPVFPVAMSVEWLAQAALHANPGWHFAGFDGLRVFSPLTLANGDSLPVQLRAGSASSRDGGLVVPTELTSGRGELHARCQIFLAEELDSATPQISFPEAQPLPFGESLYPPLFHGPHLHAIERVLGWSELGIAAEIATAPAPSEWITAPLRHRWLADPLVLDAAFQLLILWSLAVRGVPCLPVAVTRYRQFGELAGESLRMAVRITGSGEHRVAAQIEVLGDEDRLLARFEGAESVLDASLDEAFRQNQLSVELSEP